MASQRGRLPAGEGAEEGRASRQLWMLIGWSAVRGARQRLRPVPLLLLLLLLAKPLCQRRLEREPLRPSPPAPCGRGEGGRRTCWSPCSARTGLPSGHGAQGRSRRGHAPPPAGTKLPAGHRPPSPVGETRPQPAPAAWRGNVLDGRAAARALGSSRRPRSLARMSAPP